MTRTEAIRQWAEAWRNLRAWGRPLEEITVEYRRRSDRVGDYSTGRAWPGRRRVVVTHGADMADALATVLHEYAHLAVPGREHHGPRYKVMLARAASEVTGLTLDEQDVQAWKYHMLQRAVEDHMRVWWRERGLDKLWALAEDR